MGCTLLWVVSVLCSCVCVVCGLWVVGTEFFIFNFFFNFFRETPDYNNRKYDYPTKILTFGHFLSAEDLRYATLSGPIGQLHANVPQTTCHLPPAT